jgi:hypothetical protein
MLIVLAHIALEHFELSYVYVQMELLVYTHVALESFHETKFCTYVGIAPCHIVYSPTWRQHITVNNFRL